MLLTLIRKEIVWHILSLRFGVTCALMILLLFGSLYATVSGYTQARHEYHALVRTTDERLMGLCSTADPRRRFQRLFFQEGTEDPVPASGLSWIGRGLEVTYPMVFNTRVNMNEDLDRGIARNALLSLMRAPDLVYIVNVVLSLLAILFMFDAISGEAQAGTLRLTLTNPIPRHLVLLGKWIGGFVTLLVPFLLALFGGLLYANIRGVFTDEHLLRLGLLILVACLYVGVFFNLSLFVSTVTRRPATSLLVCLLVWVILVLLIPNLAPATARLIAPTDAPDRVAQAKQAVDAQIDKELRALRAEDIPRANREQRQETLEIQRRQHKRQIDAEQRRARERQIKVTEVLGRASASACWVYAASDLTDTGLLAREAVLGARSQVQRQFRTLEQELRQRQRQERAWPFVRTEDVPRLRVRLPDDETVLQEALNDLLILLILNIVFFMLAFTCFLRYDVR